MDVGIYNSSESVHKEETPVKMPAALLLSVPILSRRVPQQH